MFLTNKRAMVSAVSSIFAMVFMLFMDTIYSNYLISFGVSEKNIGYFFALSCLVYSIFSPLVGMLCNYIAKPYLTQFAFVMSFFSLILFGQLGEVGNAGFTGATPRRPELNHGNVARAERLDLLALNPLSHFELGGLATNFEFGGGKTGGRRQ